VTRSAATVEQALLDKGMERDENHHHMYRKTLEGVTHLVTRVSHGSNEIGDSLGKLMGNQLCLQLREFWDLVDCPMSEETWTELVRERCGDGRNPFLRRG
jgi:aspartate oxidase